MESLPLTVHYLLWTPPTLLLFLFLAAPRRNPFADAWATLGRLRTRSGLACLGVLLVTLVGTLIQAAFEPWLQANLGYDLTAFVRSIEGDLVERVQAPVAHAWLGFLGWFYLFGFAAAQLLPFFVHAPLGNDRAIRAYLVRFLATALLAIPFYFFTPVKEVGWSGVSDAVPLLDVWWPGVSEQTRMGSGLDNCFPSLHVGCTAMMWIFARRFGTRGYERLSLAIALGTSWVVMALGIHWFADVVSGWLHAVVATWIAAWCERRSTYPG